MTKADWLLVDTYVTCMTALIFFFTGAVVTEICDLNVLQVASMTVWMTIAFIAAFVLVFVLRLNWGAMFFHSRRELRYLCSWI